MRAIGKIVTVGLCPSWDIVCRGRGLDWGQHKQVSSAEPRPAGKAMNISLALAWMGQRNVAAGLWGSDDYEQMTKAMRCLQGMVRVKMTAADGRTRQNITVVDTAGNREMHLRAVSQLASKKSLAKLRADLKPIVSKSSICVFAGAMPQSELLGGVVRVVNCCRGRGAAIALDTSGDALTKIVNSGGIWLIKPNVKELSELLREGIKDVPISLVRAGRRLLEKSDVVLISRGKKGAMVVTKKAVWLGRHIGAGRRVLSTVGCGDYLLAGFLKGLKDKSELGFALETAIKVATAKAWGWTERKQWRDAQQQIKVEVERV